MNVTHDLLSEVREVETTPKERIIPFFNVVELKEGKREIKINYRKWVQLLKHLGFRRYDREGEHFIVHIQNNIVRLSSAEDVADKVEDYICQFSDDEIHKDPRVTKEIVLNKIYAALPTYYSDRILARLRPITPIRFNEHQKDRAFFYYKNGYVEVTEKGTRLGSYSELKACIWENQILDRDFTPKEASEFRNFSFSRFIQIISNNFKEHPKTKAVNSMADPTRELALKTVIGYLLHAYFERSLMGVILTDSKIDEDGENNGRSGKTLLVKALGHILNRDYKSSTTYVEINGKDFDPSRQFKYQNCRMDTNLIHINDAKRNFRVEALYNDVTEGVSIEMKNKSPYHVRAKIAVSSNNTIRIQGSSAKGRFIEVEIADYFSDRYTPEDEFGEWFFRDWGPEEWGMFDSFMMHCVQTYLKYDVQRPSTINLNERKKLEETSDEFVEWMGLTQFFNSEDDTESEDFTKRELFSNFIERYPEFKQGKRQIRQRTFTKWLKLYCQYDSEFLPIVKDKDSKENSYEWKSDGEIKIRFKRLLSK